MSPGGIHCAGPLIISMVARDGKRGRSTDSRRSDGRGSEVGSLVAEKKGAVGVRESPAMRAFLLFLGGSYHFLTQNRTQAYHVVAGLGPRPVSRAER